MSQDVNYKQNLYCLTGSPNSNPWYVHSFLTIIGILWHSTDHYLSVVVVSSLYLYIEAICFDYGVQHTLAVHSTKLCYTCDKHLHAHIHIK